MRLDVVVTIGADKEAVHVVGVLNPVQHSGNKVCNEVSRECSAKNQHENFDLTIDGGHLLR